MKINYLTDDEIRELCYECEDLAEIELKEESKSVLHVVAYGINSFDGLASDAKESVTRSGISSFLEDEITYAIDSGNLDERFSLDEIAEIAKYCESVIVRSGIYPETEIA